MGPQYVCTNFWTFICTNCSGLHREFTHRVKSVSMAKFTSQEVASLQGGGNERAKEIFLKEWDQQLSSFPDSSNVERLRAFIKHVYVDRRYTGDRNAGKPPKSIRDESYEQRRPETFRSGSQSPSYRDMIDRRYSERSSSGGRNDDSHSRSSYEEARSPGYDQNDYRRNAGPVEMFDGKRRNEFIGNGNQNVRFGDNMSKLDAKSSSPPMVRPVRDILGDNAPSLKVVELRKSNNSKIAESSAQVQISTSLGSTGSTTGNKQSEKKSVAVVTPAVVKSEAPKSLIDFSSDFDIPVAPPQQKSGPQQATDPSIDGGNWASFDNAPEQKSAPIANLNSLESGLSQLYGSGNANIFSNSPTTPSLFPAASSHTAAVPQSIIPQVTPQTIGYTAQIWPSSSTSGIMGQFTSPTGQVPQTSTAPNLETNLGGASQPQTVQTKSIERKELPVNLFTQNYAMGPGAVPGWQAQPQYGMGFGMQYPTVVPTPFYSYSPKLQNPFDVPNEPSLVHASSFPSMVPMQAALPTVANSPAFLRSSSLGDMHSQWRPQQQLPVIGGYMSQVQPNMNQQTSLGNQVVGDVGHQRFSSSVQAVDSNAGYPQHEPLRSGSYNSFASPSSRNPFG